MAPLDNRMNCRRADAYRPGWLTEVQVRRGASLLVLLAGWLENCAWSAAQAAPQGQFGATSKGSITLSVSVRPQVLLSRVAAPNDFDGTVTVARTSAQHICLLSGNSSGNHALLLQSADGGSQTGRSTELSASEAATSLCRSGGGAGARSAGFQLPATVATGTGSYTLLVAPE
jgi:hypothetical protein